MSDPNDLKVLVKKPDGTFVHVPLSDLKKNKQTDTGAIGSVALPKNIPEPPQNFPVKTNEEKKSFEVTAARDLKKEQFNKPKFDKNESEKFEKELPAVVKKTEAQKPVAKVTTSQSTSAPVAIKQTPVSTPKPILNKEDFKSPLEERLPAISKFAPLTSESREKQVEEIVKSLSFKVPVQNTSRIKTIVQIYLKEIRSKEDTLEILQRPEIEGGVGLSETQASEVVEKCQKTILPSTNNPVAFAQKPVSVSSEIKKIIPSVQPKPPVKNVFEDLNKGVANQKVENKTVDKPVANKDVKYFDLGDARKVLEDQITKATLAEAPIQQFKINTDKTKTTMHDVKAAPMQMGPVEEIRYFSLTDFRRLSADPNEAAKRFKQKFLNLREESIVLYFEALDAWQKSPLHEDYMKVVCEAILKRLPLARAASEKTKIQLSEIYSLIQMEKELG